MSDSFFLFKQFIVHHDRCAMKVGTDGVLLGAWAPVDQAHTALDVGTGTGLIALQLAQRNPHLRVTADRRPCRCAGGRERGRFALARSDRGGLCRFQRFPARWPVRSDCFQSSLLRRCPAVPRPSAQHRPPCR